MGNAGGYGCHLFSSNVLKMTQKRGVGLKILVSKEGPGGARLQCRTPSPLLEAWGPCLASV